MVRVQNSYWSAARRIQQAVDRSRQMKVINNVWAFKVNAEFVTPEEGTWWLKMKTVDWGCYIEEIAVLGLHELERFK